MKIPDTLEFGFNFKTSHIQALHHPIGKILWAGIKFQHIVDKEFNMEVLDVAQRIEKDSPISYEQFMQIIKSSRLFVFGSSANTSFTRIYDEEFWGDMWDFIRGHRELKFKVEPLRRGR